MLRSIITLLVISSYAAASESIKLNEPFHNSKEIIFNYINIGDGVNDFVGVLTPPPVKNLTAEIKCTHEGSDATLHTAFTYKGKDELLIATCQNSLNHRGLGIVGTLYTTQILSIVNGKAVRMPDLENKLSGYEGSNEDGKYSYFFYDDKELLTSRINSIALPQKELSTAYKIIIKRLKNKDYEAINNYLTKDRLFSLRENNPISSKTVQIYNDLGFSLSESGNQLLALDILYAIEKISPSRAVLQLNIADALWATNRTTEAKAHYAKYIKLMSIKNLNNKIPDRAFDRI